MLTLERIKNDYAISKGYADWFSLLLTTTRNNEYYILELHIETVMVLLQKECLKLASENACLEIGINEIDKQSITNENNIIK